MPFPPAVRQRVRAIAGAADGVFAEAKQRHGQTIEKARYGEIAGFVAVAPERRIAGRTKPLVSLPLRFVSPHFVSALGVSGAAANVAPGPFGLAPRTARTPYRSPCDSVPLARSWLLF
jgi:hypothetical protein